MKLNGILMRPCSTTLDGNEFVMRSTEYFTESEFRKKYEHNLGVNQIIAESAKIYILTNYQKVSDWSDLDIELSKNINGDKVHYYSYKAPADVSRRGRQSALDRIRQQREKDQNPAQTVTDVVLDPTDGDFSLTINGTEHWWLYDDEVIIIADFIEKHLRKA